MALSAPAPRKDLHRRSIVCQGFARDDGLWDIEGRLRDEKTYDFENHWRGRVDAGMPVHEMLVRLTLDDKFVIHGIEVAMEAAPFAGCNSIEGDFSALVGHKLGRGWNRLIRDLVGGIKGCTHVTEVLGRMAMTAYQTIPIEQLRRAKKAARTDPAIAEKLRKGPERKPFFIGGCHTWRIDGKVVHDLFPAFYRAPDSAPPEDDQ